MNRFLSNACYIVIIFFTFYDSLLVNCNYTQFVSFLKIVRYLCYFGLLFSIFANGYIKKTIIWNYGGCFILLFAYMILVGLFSLKGFLDYGVVGISHFILDKHLKCGYFSKAKYREVIYNSIEKTECTADRDPYTIGYMGSILPSKGVERLISDFSKLDNKNYTLEIAGDYNTDYVAYLKNKYSSPNIKFLGRVSAKDFLSHISLLVVPSEWHEPFGRVVGEAIMAGCPVFVSNRGGMPELVNHENGRVFSLEEKDSLFNLLSDYVRGKMHF